MVAGGHSRLSGQVEEGRGEESDPAFEAEILCVGGTFVVKEREKIIPTLDANGVTSLVVVFRKDPYIYITRVYRYDSRSLESLRAAIQLPPEYSLRMPMTNEMMFLRPKGHWVWLPVIYFRHGLKFPLHLFIKELLKNFFHCALGQIVPNSILLINVFIVHCVKRKIKPNHHLFFYMFKFQKFQMKEFYQL